MTPALSFPSLLPRDPCHRFTCQRPTTSWIRPLQGSGICPERFFLRPSMSKYPRSTDGPNGLPVRARAAGCSSALLRLSSESLSSWTQRGPLSQDVFPAKFSWSSLRADRITIHLCIAHTHTHIHTSLVTSAPFSDFLM